MANRKKAKKQGTKTSRVRKSSGTRRRSKAATLAAQSTVFTEEASFTSVATSTPAHEQVPTAHFPLAELMGPLAHPQVPAVRAPTPGAIQERVVNHSIQRPSEPVQPETKPAPQKSAKPRPVRPAQPAQAAHAPWPEKLTQAQIYETLAALLVPYARKMESEMHPKIGFCLKARSARTGRETHFGGVQALADGVVFHLFPLYGHPDLLEGLSPELINCMRGKTCFHFAELDAALAAELAALTRSGFERFMADGVL